MPRSTGITYNDLPRLLGYDLHQLQLQALTPLYYCFSIPKGNGKYRYIESPNEELKVIQRRLSNLFQNMYMLERPNSVKGYVRGIKNPIIDNALAHKKSRYMLKVDFKDFFHQILKQRLYNLFMKRYGIDDKKCARLLTQLVCYKGRLPMGAPTSPILSNMSIVKFDREIETLTATQNITYTRYADDLTFSSFNHFKQDDLLNLILHISKKHQIKINPDKTEYYDYLDDKIVTGILIDDPISPTTDFLKQLEKDIVRLAHCVDVQAITGSTKGQSMVRKFSKSIEGKLRFLSNIEGSTDDQVKQFQQSYKEALVVNEDVLAANWQQFNYF